LISPPEQLWLRDDAWTELVATRRGADLMGAVARAGEASRYATTLVMDGSPAEVVQRSMERLKNHLAELAANAVAPVILCDNQGQRDRLSEMLGESGATLGVGLVSAGFVWKDAGVAVMTDHEIFSPVRRPRPRAPRPGRA